MGDVEVIELAALVDPSFQPPALLQLQGHEAIGIAAWDAGLADQ